MAKKKGASPAGKHLMALGLVLMLGAAGLYGYNQYVDYRAGQASEQAAMDLVEEITAQQVVIQETAMTTVADEDGPSEELLKVAELNGAYYMGVLTIPDLDLILPVQSDWSDSKLKRTPCRYSGSLEDGGLVIAGHNYKKHFSKLSTLSPGDSVMFTDLEGTQYFYEVQELCTLEETDIQGMTESGYDLSLFTCNYGGQARVTVRCNELEKG